MYIDHFHSESICDFKMHVIAKNKKKYKIYVFMKKRINFTLRVDVF